MLTTTLVAFAALLAALMVVLAVGIRRVLTVRALTIARRRVVEREERLADLRMQRAVQDTVQRLFDAARQRR